LVEHGGDPLGAVRDEGGGYAEFDVLEFLVKGAGGDGESSLGAEVLVSGINGGLLSQDHLKHEIRQGGKEDFVLILLLGSVAEELVELVGAEEAFEAGPAQDSDGGLVDKGLKGLR
jgi:hypothetical protein